VRGQPQACSMGGWDEPIMHVFAALNVGRQECAHTDPHDESNEGNAKGFFHCDTWGHDAVSQQQRVPPTTRGAKERDPSCSRAIPESDFAVTAQTPPRRILFRDRVSAKKHPRFRKDASEPENREIPVSPFASFAGARCDPANVRLRLRVENSSRGRNYFAVPAMARKALWRREESPGAKSPIE